MFWDTKQLLPFHERLKEAFKLDKAILRSPYLLSSQHDLRYCKLHFFRVGRHVRSFRKEISRGQISDEALTRKKAREYGLYAQTMNELESLTG